MTTTKTIARTAEEIALNASNAYSADRYGSWKACALMLLKRGYDEHETDAILRSKWTRWAADASNARYGKVPASAIATFLDAYGPQLKAHVSKLVRGTL